MAKWLISKMPTQRTYDFTDQLFSYDGMNRVMIFTKADEFQNTAQSLEDFAISFKSKLMFIYVDITNENLVLPFLTLFCIDDANRPVSGMEAAYGTAKSGVDVTSIGVMKHKLVLKSIVHVVMAGVLGIFGLIIDVIISTGINPSLACSLAGLSVGMTIGLSEMPVSGKMLSSLSSLLG